jgi:hypothetical protein
MLSAESVARYHAIGFVLIPKLISEARAEILAFEGRRLCNDRQIVNPLNIRTRFINTNVGPLLEKIDPVVDISRPFEQVARDPHIVRIAGQLLGWDSPALFRDKLIVKPPRFPGYPLHQDYSWWHEHNPNEMVSFAIALELCLPETGPLQFVRSSHGRIIVPKGERRAITDEELSEIETFETEECCLEPGDGVAFHPLAVHWSGPNLTQRSRMMFYPGFIRSQKGGIYENHRLRQTTKLLENLGQTECGPYYFS